MCGHLNGLVVRIFGTKGAIEWVQEEPDRLLVIRKGEPQQIYCRGTGYITGRAAELNHIPSGHPEGLTYAFANIYHSFMSAVLKTVNGEEIGDAEKDYPSVSDGVKGVEFVQAVIASGKEGAVWKEV